MRATSTEPLDLSVALISSYATGGIWSGDKFHEFVEGALRADAPSRTVTPDLYLLMESDVHYWTNRFQSSSVTPVPAIRFLAGLTDDKIDQITDGVWENLGGTCPVAISTFLPEISLSKNNPRADLAASAIRNLLFLTVKIGASFMQRTDGAKTPVIQLVAGNEFESIHGEWSEARSRDEFNVKISDEKDAYGLILERLSECFQDLETKCGAENDLSLAFEQLRVSFELEPGALYLLDGKESIKRFCELIDTGGAKQCPFVKEKVGFN